MRKIAIGRLVGVLLAIAGISVSVWTGSAALSWNAAVNQCRAARPMLAAIDLSTPGKTTVPFAQTCSMAHGESLNAEVASDGLSASDIEALFIGLRGRIIISDFASVQVDAADFGGHVLYYDDQVQLAWLGRFPEGHYLATIHVDSGAPGLAHRKHTVFAKYHLCGLENMPTLVGGALALGSGFIGLTSAAFVGPSLVRSGVWRRDHAEDAEPVTLS